MAHSRVAPFCPGMWARGTPLPVLCIAAALVAGEAPAHAQERCLSPQEQRQALRARKLVPLAAIVRTLPRGADVVRAELCEADNDGHVYVLTVLRRDGKVVRQVFDATTGTAVQAK